MQLFLSISLKKLVLITGLLVIIFTFFTAHAHAATLSSASATLTTSRPSPSSPLSADAAAGVGSLSVFSNGSRYLASDSAKIIRATGIVSNPAITIASQSAAFTTVYLAGTLGTGGGAGADVLYVPITSMHTISFTTITSIPSGGKIVINYAGSGNNTASPSASTFAFNNLSSSDISYRLNTGGTVTCTSLTVSAPTITCTTTGGTINAGSVVTFLLGCADGSTNETSCTTQRPRLINPTKAATAGTADIWKIALQTTDGSNNVLDSSSIALGIVESVTVRATIDPSLTFSIAGVSNGAAVNVGNTTGCLQTETTNSGIDSTSTDVSLGTLSIAPAAGTKLNNITAQTLTVTTNGANGYSITATSSGRLINAATGYFINSSTTPQSFPATGHFFGMHACGLDTDLTYWNSTGSSACNTYVPGSNPVCRYGWPNSVAPILVAQDTSGPIGNTIAAGNGITSVSYAATQDVTLPPGNYQSVITYVATPSF